MKRPNVSNTQDACCRCSKLMKTPKDHEKPVGEELLVWQPNPADPPQWICSSCHAQLTEDARRFA